MDNFEDSNRPTEATAAAVVERISPRGKLRSIEPLPGSYSNYTHLVSAALPDGTTGRYVIRRYKVFGDYDRGEKAVREFRTLEHMSNSGIPVPRPLLLDPSGDLLGTPGIVTAFVRGRQVDQPDDPEPWARRLGEVLARIHTVRVDDTTRRILLDANAEVTWFIRGETVPGFMSAHPEGPRVWELVKKWYERRNPVPAGLVHVDVWSGNILWDEGRISAVVDWEEAAWGEPEIDLAYLRMDLVLSGMGAAWETVRGAYERTLGRPAENLGLWELVSAARPMFSPDDWISDSPAVERFRRFIDEAEARLA